MWDKWVVDITLWKPENPDWLCFIPVEDELSETPKFIIGMNFLASPEGFDQGEVVGIIHKDGQDVIDRWCLENPSLLQRILRR